MRSVVVGCPLSHRGWIIRDWWMHLLEALETADLYGNYQLVFVGDTTKDPEMWDWLHRNAGGTVVHIDETRGSDKRVWKYPRYEHMAMLRNLLLEQVRALNPTYFVSLDSDILLNHQALRSAVELIDEGTYDAVAMGCYMTRKGTSCPNHGILTRERQMRRSDWRGHGPVDIIMAAKVMNRAAYNIDYAPTTLGEDIGWSNAAREARLRLGWDGRIMSRHVLSPDMLNEVDPRLLT